MCDNIIKSILNEKIIVIVRGLEKDSILDFAQAVYDGGIRLLEVTYNASNPDDDVKTAEMIKLLSEKFCGKMHIGAGTVLTEKQVELTKENGGAFIISPDTNPCVIKKTKELGLVSIPGALTPTEIQIAHTAGADFVKLFPITNMGPQYVKAVMAPLSHVKFLAVGGINENNISEYLGLGVCGFGIGSDIVDKNAIKIGNFEKIKNLAENYVSLVK